MDFCRNVSLSGDTQQKQTTLDDLFSTHNTEVDMSLEWLSVFVEDCLSSKGNCLPAIPTSKKASNPLQNSPASIHKFTVPGKARSKRKRITTAKTSLTSWLNPQYQALQMPSTDPPLLNQAYWLADSELIVANKEDGEDGDGKQYKEGRDGQQQGRQQQQQQQRRCSHCLSQRTPQWRAGPLGPKTLCNACGVRYKSGRLLPEYRPIWYL